MIIRTIVDGSGRMADRDSEKELDKMIEAPVQGLIASLAVPAVAGMLVSAAYNLVDAYYVGRVGTEASAAVGVVFPLEAFLQALGYTLGMGAAGQMSRLLGEKRNQEADSVLSTAVFSAVGVGAAVAVLGLVFLSPLMRFLGAIPPVMPYAVAYAAWLLPGAPLMCASFVLNCGLRAEGKTKLAMAGVLTGCLANVALAPFFLFSLRMGIAGAGLASALSQALSFFVLLFCYARGRTIVKISPKRFSFGRGVQVSIWKTGAPSFIHQGMNSAASVVLNIVTSGFGDAALAAMSIVSRSFYFILAALIGFGQGLQPVAGYNYGAKRYDRVWQGFWFSLLAGASGMLALCAAGFFFAPHVVALFRPGDALVIADGALALRAQCVTAPVHTFVVLSNMMFQSIGRTKRASLIAAMRQGICFLPAVLILPHFLGFRGVQFAQSAADVLSFLLCIPAAAPFLGRLRGSARTGRTPGKKYVSPEDR